MQFAKKKKGDQIRLTIEDLSTTGEGVAKQDGFIFFVKDTLIGDVVVAQIMKCKSSYGYAKVISYEKRSEHWMDPICPVARQCGGCQLQHCAYDEQLRYKQEKVLHCFVRIAGMKQETVQPLIEPIVGMDQPFYYRNKAQFPVQRDKNGIVQIGFYAKHTHVIIPTTTCYIQAKEQQKTLQVIRDFLQKYQISSYDEATHTGLVRHILIRVSFFTKEQLVCLVLNGTVLPYADRLVEQLTQIKEITSIGLNYQPEQNNVILGKEGTILWGNPYIIDRIGPIQYQISAQSFYQVNPIQTEKLYEAVARYANLQGTECVYDLYCGIGTIALFLAKQAKQVYGIEIVPQAVADAIENAKRNAIENATFLLGAVEDVLPKEELPKPDLVVLDPPRKGCAQSLLDTIVTLQPQKVVYVSCDPATLARDLKYLLQKGYEMIKAQPFDLFPQTAHVETVVLLSKLKTDKHIDVELEMDELDLTAAESKATYAEIKQYVLDKTGLKVSQLYIAQVKRKHELIERINYHLGEKESKVPQVPLEKEQAIEDALRYFKMI